MIRQLHILRTLLVMQTFLPLPDLAASARCLDDRRLGKQRVEAMQVLNALHRLASPWRRHPTVRMWAGYEDALRFYMNACIDEWVRRGFNNRMLRAEIPSDFSLPPWFGDDRYHRSHRAALLRKQPDFYSRYGWTDDPAMPYFWPECAELQIVR